MYNHELLYCKDVRFMVNSRLPSYKCISHIYSRFSFICRFQGSSKLSTNKQVYMQTRQRIKITHRLTKSLTTRRAIDVNTRRHVNLMTHSICLIYILLIQLI